MSNARTSAIFPDELPAYQAHGWERQYDLHDGRVLVLWCGQGQPPEPGRVTCGNGCGCDVCRERESNTIAAAYLRLDPAAWPALEEQVRARLEAART